MDPLAQLERALAASERAVAQETRDVDAIEQRRRVVEANIDVVQAENQRLREVLAAKRAELSAARDDKREVEREMNARAEAVKEMEELLRARDVEEEQRKNRRLRAMREEIEKEEFMHTAMKRAREDMDVCQKIRELTRNFEGGPLVTDDDELSERIPRDVLDALRQIAELREENEAKKRSLLEGDGGGDGAGAPSQQGVAVDAGTDVMR